MIPIDCPAQNYAWGKKGSSSMVARLKSSSNESFVIDNEQCYAELWMGTHPSSPAKISGSEMTLGKFLEDKPHLVGAVPEGYAPNDLPFLFKILSIRNALSIQAHPDKALARRLHASSPANYADANHKPEMVIALTNFECICGFRSLTAIRVLLAGYGEFVHLLALSGFDLSSAEGSEDDILRRLFQAYMRSNDRDSTFQLDLLVERLRGERSRRPLDPLEGLLLRLHEQFPGDKGVFAPLIMNHLNLHPGKSFFICANEPHAYIAGDCAECMALSDNVVRAGLTPKFKDVDTLCEMLTYQAQEPTYINTLRGANPNTEIYRPPLAQCAEFEVERISMQAGHKATLDPLPCASIMLLLEGDEVGLLLKNSPGHEKDWQACLRACSVRLGATVFLAAGSEVVATAGADNAVILRAHVNLSA